MGTFGRALSAVTSSEGGATLCISAQTIERLRQSEEKVHRRGRVITCSVRSDTWTHSSTLPRHGEVPKLFVLGDLNFVVIGGACMLGDGTSVYAADHIADPFAATYADCCELI